MGGGVWCTTAAWLWVGMPDILLYIIILTNININIAKLDITRGVLEIPKLSSTIGGTVLHSLSSEIMSITNYFCETKSMNDMTLF